ncbi:MAG: DUF58 domain-containing protein [Prevotellaceae bacterium]|jgi:hypothetical protein|nr:DUF58 domain-containing protein [Prevotellaceae bacterium]
MKRTQLSRRIFTFFDVIPFTFTALVFVAASAFAYSYLTNNYNVGELSSQAVFAAVARYLLLFVFAIVISGFFSAMIAYIIFAVRTKKDKKYLQILFDIINDKKNNITSSAKLKINKLLFPLFGSVKVRFVFENKFTTKKYALSSKKFKLFSTKNFETKCVFDFPNVQNYALKSVKFYFEDYFSLFSFLINCNANAQFYILPSSKNKIDIVPNPVSQQNTQTRTNIIKHLPGEYLHFKDFEDSDDVRRIVWKIFAKNKELVVRIQELRNNYASRYVLYASFFNNKDLFLQTDNFSRAFLTCYKNSIFGIYSELKQNKAFEVNIKFDQTIKVASESELLIKEMFEISAAEWQNELSPDDFYKVGDVSLLCLSSFVTADDVEKLLNITSKLSVIVFVRLSDALKSNKLKLFAENIFMKPKRGSIDELRLKFLFSPLRKRLLANEKKIIELLNKSDNTFYVI